MADTKTETRTETTPVVNFDAQPDQKAAAGNASGNGPTKDAKSGDSQPGQTANPAQPDGKPEQPADQPAEQRSAPPPEGQQNQKKAAPHAEAKLDPETENLVKAEVDARLKSSLEGALNAKVEALLEVNRQLGLFLGEQMEIAIELRQSVRALERLMETDARRKGRYAAMLEEVKSEGDGMADPHWINRTRGMLSQLKRTGTTGPKLETEPGQS